MAVSGFYTIQFQAALPGMGGIIALTHSGEVYGGDGNYVYSGRYIVENTKISANLRIQPITQDAVSVFNTLGKSFDLKFSGISDGNAINLGAESPFGGPAIKVTGKKVAEVVV